MIKVDGKEYQDVLFVHIPKTAGSSISLQLKSMGLNNWVRTFYKAHDPLFMLTKQNNITSDIFKFSVVRNPYTRTYSYYNHFLKINEIGNDSLSFKDFLLLLERKEINNKTPLIHFDQSFYLHDIENNIILDKIYRFENLEALEKDLEISLPNINSGQYSNEDYIRAYSDQYTIHRVKELYREDFESLGYSKDFEKTIV